MLILQLQSGTLNYSKGELVVMMHCGGCRPNSVNEGNIEKVHKLVNANSRLAVLLFVAEFIGISSPTGNVQLIRAKNLLTRKMSAS